MKIVSIPVEVITLFSTTGDIKPYRFRYKDNEEEKVIKVDKIIKKNESNFAGESTIVYTCQSLINDVLKIFELKYEKRNCKWFLYKV